MVAEVYRAAGRLMVERGKLSGVADEGGYWPAFDTNEDAIAVAVAAIEAARFRPGEDVAIALDVAASELYRDNRYHLSRGGSAVDADGMAEMIMGWLDRYPIVSVEDPFADTDETPWRKFTAALGSRIQIVGDDLLVTDAERVAHAAGVGLCNAALIKPNQVGTLTEARAALVGARAVGFSGIVSARSGETEDVTIVHLAVGWDASQIKVGSFSRSERMAKWNEAIRIEQALGLAARFAGRAALAVRR
jgi:enolase